MNPLPGQSMEGFWEWIDEMVKTLGKTFTKSGFRDCTQEAEWHTSMVVDVVQLCPRCANLLQ